MVLLAGANGAATSEPVFVEPPEPEEQMKPCEAYGQGWYYLPGTTTCVKISGDVRLDYSSQRSQGNRN